MAGGQGLSWFSDESRKPETRLVHPGPPSGRPFLLKGYLNAVFCSGRRLLPAAPDVLVLRMMALAAIKTGIVMPVVAALALPGDATARIQLMTGIGNVETAYRTRRQYGGGPALGFWQVEPRTHDDIWRNFLSGRPALAEVARRYLPAACGGVPMAEAMTESDIYAACMASLVFYRSPAGLPVRDNARAQCAAWKQAYNTAAGAGRVDATHIAAFQAAISA